MLTSHLLNKKNKSRNKSNRLSYAVSASSDNPKPPLIEQTMNRILNKISEALSHKESYYGYSSDILSALREEQITSMTFLDVCVFCLKNKNRNISDIHIIKGYLFILKDLVNILRQYEQGFLLDDYMQTLAMYIEYEYIQPKKIICKLGDIGDKAYLVLDGEVDIFTKQSRHIQLTKYNYLRYLGSLLQYEEYGLLFSTLKDNYKSIPIEIVYVNDYEHANLKREDYLWRYEGNCFAMSSKEIVFSINELIKLNGGSKCNDIYNIDNIESYIKRIEPCLDNKNDIVLNVVIYTYIHLTSKKNGELIGEHAVSSKSTRCATLIARKPCHIGLISKNLYDVTLKKCIETIKRKNILFLQSFSIFNNINSNILSTKYYNNFLRQTVNKNTYIIKQSLPIERMYMIKDGLFHITFKGSLLELVDLKYEYKVKQMKYLISSNNSNSNSSNLQWYIEKVNVSKKKDLTYYKRILHDYPSFKDEFYKRSVFLLSQAVSPDIIGLFDYVSDTNYKSYFNVQCVSAKGDVLTLHNSCFNEIKTDNSIVKDLEIELNKQRLSQMLERIELIIKTRMKVFTNENLSVKNIPIEQDNIHLKLNTKKINSFTFHPDIMHYYTNKNSASKSKPMILNLLYKQSTSDLHCMKHTNKHNIISNSKDNINNNSINNHITNTNATFCSFTKPRLTKTNSFTNSNTTVSNSTNTNSKSRNTSLFTKHKQSHTKIITPFYTSNNNSETNSTSVSKSKCLYRSSNHHHKTTSPFCLVINTHIDDKCNDMPLLYIKSQHKCVYNNTLSGNSHKYVRTNHELRKMGLLQGTKHQTVKPTSVSIEKYYLSKRKSFVLKRNNEHKKRSVLLKCKYYFSKETI